MTSKLYLSYGRRSKPRESILASRPPKIPRTERVLYVAKLKSFWNMWEGAVHSEFGLYGQQYGRDARRDAGPLLSATFEQLLKNSKLGDFIEGLGLRVVGKAKRYTESIVRTKLVLPGREQLLADFRARNIALIKNLGTEQSQQLEQLLSNVSSFAVRHEELAPEIQKVLDVGDSRAQLIARDQILKINSQAQQLSQTSAGIEEYTWRTSEDERVRDSHQELDGTVHGWDDPPIVDGEAVHPGEAIQCRCVAIPRIPLLDDI